MKLKKYLCSFCVISLMAILLTVPAFAAGGDVAGAVEQTWDDAATDVYKRQTKDNGVTYCYLFLGKPKTNNPYG